MTISTTTSRQSYNGNGVTTEFAVPFRFFANTDLVVQLVTVSTGASTTLTLTTHYTVTGADDEDGGSLTMLVAPAVGQRLVIRRVIPATQEVDYVAGDPFPAETHERALDRLTMLAQQGEEVNARALVFPAGDTASGELPAVATRASRLLGFDSLGNLVTSAPASGSAAELAIDLAGTASGEGAALIGANEFQTQNEVNDERITVTQFGALGTGSSAAQDTAAFITAYTTHPGKTIYVPEPPVAYDINALLVLPANTIFKGDRRQGTPIRHAYNGDFANLGDGAGFEDCWIQGQGATYTGGCFVFSGTNGRQIRRGVCANDFDGPIEVFGIDSGSQSLASDVRYARRNAGTGTERYAVVIDPNQKIGAVPRKFIGYESDGTCSFDFGGGNNTMVSNSFLGDVKFHPESRAIYLNNTRIANQLALTIDGQQIMFSSCDFSPQITIAPGADAIAIQACVYNNLPVIDNSGNGFNLIDHWAESYTPVLTSGGVAPTLGDGTLTGKASRSGSTGRVLMQLTVGSTTNLGTGDLRFSLPTWMPNNNTIVQICGTAIINRGVTNYTAAIQIPAATQWARLIRDTSGSITFNSPATWSAGDFFRLSFEYDIG